MRAKSPIFLLFLLLLVTQTIGYHEPDLATMYHCKDIESNSTVMQLKNYLFCTYDQDIRPTENHRNITEVKFGIIPKHIDVFDQQGVIQIHAWTKYIWMDEHLSWDPAKYDGIEWLHLMNYEVWTPDIMVHSGGNLSPTTDMPYTHCWLYYVGVVYCQPPTVYSTTCIGERTWWPYDALNCTVHFGSWSHADNEIQFAFIYPGNRNVTLTKYHENHEWDVVRFYEEEHKELSKFGLGLNTTLLSYNIVLKRRASMLHTAYVIPAIVLMIMTLLTLWLEPKSTERMIIANLNLVCHLLCIEDIHWRVRYNGANIPKLFVFYEFSLILASLSLILTSMLRNLQERTTKAPGYILSGTSFVLKSKIGQILLISVLDPKMSAIIEANADDNTDLVNPNRKESVWGYVTILIGWVAFVTVFITYNILLATLIPTSTSSSYALNS